MRNYETYKRLLTLNQEQARLKTLAESEFKSIFKPGANVSYMKSGALQVGKILKVSPEEQQLKVRNVVTGSLYLIKLYQVLEAEDRLS